MKIFIHKMPIQFKLDLRYYNVKLRLVHTFKNYHCEVGQADCYVGLAKSGIVLA